MDKLSTEAILKRGYKSSSSTSTIESPLPLKLSQRQLEWLTESKTQTSDSDVIFPDTTDMMRTFVQPS
jgi:uncharacterized protein YaaW (UPF0174 family)